MRPLHRRRGGSRLNGRKRHVTCRCAHTHPRPRLIHPTHVTSETQQHMCVRAGRTSPTFLSMNGVNSDKLCTHARERVELRTNFERFRFRRVVHMGRSIANFVAQFRSDFAKPFRLIARTKQSPTSRSGALRKT